jgi:uncharacterized membrane protein YiaA
MEPLQNTRTDENLATAKYGDKTKRNPFKPTAAFIGASWFALLVGVIGYCIGLWNATIQLERKRLLFHHFIIRFIRRYLGTKKREGQIRRIGRYRPCTTASAGLPP